MENPLVGSFNRERTVLTFRQRSLEFFASLAGMALGALLLLAVPGKQFLPFLPVVFAQWNLLFGALFFLASLWAYFGFRSIRFDLRRGTYGERLRIGALPTMRTGELKEVRCLELAPYDGIFPTALAQAAAPGMLAAPVQFGQLYVVRLWWHDPSRPPVVIEHVQAQQAYGSADAQLAGFAQRAQMYANALRVPMYSRIALPGMQKVQ